MSFGWSAGDIASAVKLLVVVGKAAKEAFGDSSKYCAQISSVVCLQKTLQTIQAFDGVIATVEAGRLEDLREQCRLLRIPVEAFLTESKRFEPALTSSNIRGKILSAPRRLRWALFMPEKIKHLQECTNQPMLSINLLFGLQTMEIVTLYQNSIPHTVREQISTVLREAFQLDTGQALGDFMTVIQGYRDGLQSRQAIIGQEMAHFIQSVSVRASDDRRTNHIELVEMIRLTISEVHSLAQRVTELKTNYTDVREGLISSDDNIQSRTESQPLPFPNTYPDADTPSQNVNNELARGRDDNIILAMEDLQRDFLRWYNYLRPLHTILQIVLQKLALILIPYMATLSRRLPQNKWQFSLILIGDRFLFEDGLGRTNALSCADFQHWENFYSFLKKSFEDGPGITHVRSQSFEMTNAYNGSFITPQIWQVVIQPKARINMAMLVETTKPGEGSCPVSRCTGSLKSIDDSNSSTCTLCGKHITLAQSTTGSSSEVLNSNNKERYSSGSQRLTSGLLEEQIESLRRWREPLGEQRQHRSAPPIGKSDAAVKNSTNFPDISQFKRIAIRRTYILPKDTEVVDLDGSDTDLSQFVVTDEMARRLSLIPNRNHDASLEYLSTELQFMIFKQLDKIDSCCLGLVHPNLYVVYRAIHGTKMPLSTRRIGPNTLESAWNVTGRQECKQCSVYRCELHVHIKTWMPSTLEYCVMKQNFGLPAKPGARSTCFRGKPSKPRRCGRHPSRVTSIHQADTHFNVMSL